MKNFYLKNKKYIIFFLIFLLYFRLTIPLINWYFREVSKCFKLEINIAETDNLLKCVYTLFKKPQILLIFVFISFLIILATYNVIYTIKKVKIETEGIKYKNKDGTFGTADWSTIEEAKEFLSVGKEDGIVFGQTTEGESVCLPEDTFLNKNIAVFGASGSRKTRAFVILNILVQASLGKSIVCTDPKGELYKKCAKYLVKKGYNVKLLNLVNPEYSDCWNPIAEVETETDAQVFAEVVIANTEINRSKGGDEFWTRTEQNLLKALILHIVYEVEDENKKNMGYLYSIISSGDIKKIDKVFEHSKGAARMSYNIYAQATDVVKQSTVTGLATRLQIFQTDEINAVTMKNDIDLEDIGSRKSACFCISSDMDTTFSFLFSLFFSFLFIKLIRKADRNESGRLDVETKLMLDEFTNVGKLLDIEVKLSTIRSRALSCIFIFQSITQLQNRYDVWQELLGNCDTKLVFGCNDMLSATYVSDLLGVSTVETSAIRKEAGFDGKLTLGKQNISISKRNLSNPDEIIKQDNDELIVIVRAKKALKLRKFDYSQHYLSKEMEEIKIEEYKEKLKINKDFFQNNTNEEEVVLPTFDDFFRRKNK